MGFWAWFLLLALLGLGCFMILLVLLQRGRGGGLVGALGGPGGQSAFGARAGDVFTKITVGVAVAWVVLAGVSGMVLRHNEANVAGDLADDRVEVPDAPSDLPAGSPLDDASMAPLDEAPPAPDVPDAGADAAVPAEVDDASEMTAPGLPAAGAETPAANAPAADSTADDTISEVPAGDATDGEPAAGDSAAEEQD